MWPVVAIIVGGLIWFSGCGKDEPPTPENGVPPNNPPEITSSPPTEVTAGEQYSYDVDATDLDSDPLTFILNQSPAGMTIDPVSGLITWTPAYSQIGENTVTVEATDNEDSDFQTFDIAVNPITQVTINGRQILVNGSPFTAKGVAYQPTPIGDRADQYPYGDYYTSNYSEIYERDIPLLRDMHCNVVRLWGWSPPADHTDFLDQLYNNGVDPIYVIAALWVNQNEDLSDPSLRNNYLQQFSNMVARHKDHPAILMWAFGNEVNNFTPNKDAWFSLLNEAAAVAHNEEGEIFHPVTTANLEVADILTYDSSVPNLDVWGINVYRGPSFGDLFSTYEAASSKPLVLHEYGIDAFCNNCSPQGEYELVPPFIPFQANYAASLWDEIVANSNVCSGASIMEYCDEWWKDWTGNPDIHDNGGYVASSHPDNYANEEWWGIMRTMDDGINPDIMEPREVFYTLQVAWE